MKYRITVKTEGGSRTYSAIGDLGLLVDAEYDAGALGVTVMVL
ncbi:hypothetical protein AB4Z19_15425 [Pseudoduganella sp. RAF19]